MLLSSVHGSRLGRCSHRPSRCHQQARHLVADGEGGGGGRAGGVEDVQGARARDEAEVLHQLAARGHGLGAHAGTAGFEVGFANLGDEPLQRGAEQLFAERTLHFLPAHALVFAHEAPQAAERERVEQVARVEIRFAIALAREGEHGVRTGLDAAIDCDPRVVQRLGRSGIGRGAGGQACRPAGQLEAAQISGAGQVLRWRGGGFLVASAAFR